MRLIALSFARFFARTPWTTATALFGAALGVASTVAVHLLSLAVADALDVNQAPHLRGLTHIAAKPAATMDDYFALRRHWRAGGLPGARALVPLVEGQIVEDGRRLHVVGVDWLALYGLSGERTEVRLRPGSIVADSSLSLAIGERIRLIGKDWRVADRVDSGVRDGIFTDIGDALALLNAPPDYLSHVGIALDDPWQGFRAWLEALLPGLSAGFGTRAYPAGQHAGVAPACEGTAEICAPAGWEWRPISFEQPGANLANSILFNLGALGMLALLVAWFLIYQVCVLWLRRQAPVMESLAVLGASRAELAACFVAVVAVLGTLAALLGLVGGLWLAKLLTTVSTAGLAALPAPQLSAAVVVKALVSGLGVAVVGGWIALGAERAAAAAEVKTSPRWLIWLFILPVLAGLGIGIPETGLAGGFLAILATAFFTVALVRPLLRVLARLSRQLPTADAGALSPGSARGYPSQINNSPRPGRAASGSPDSLSSKPTAESGRLSARGLLTRLAVREATWHERDLGTALGALVLAVATSVGIGLMVASFKLEFEKMLTQRLAYEHYVELAGGDAPALARAITERWPDTQWQSYGDVRTRIAGRVIAIDHADYSATEVARYGHGAALAPHEGLASESLLLALNIDVGDSVNVAGSPIKIVGAFADYGGVLPRLLLQNVTTARLLGPLHFKDIALSGVSGAALRAWLAENAPGAELREREPARARALEIFDRSFAITHALTLLALMVAVAGLYNAMTGLRLNRVATRQLLTVLGISAAQDRWIELLRALGLGACTLMLALPLGLAMGWLLCEVINPRAFGWRIDMSLPGSALAWPTALGFLAAVVAAIAPSPRERFEAAL